MVYIGKKHSFRNSTTMSKILFYERRNTRKMCVNFQPKDEKPPNADQKGETSASYYEAISDPKKGPKGVRCKGCNYLEEEHAYYETRKPWYDTKTWRSDLHLETVDFGKTGINRKIRIMSEVGAIDKMADLTIVADDTHPVIVVEHLIEDWNLTLPNICISVAGTTGRQVTMLPRYLNRLKQGLLRAVCSTSCWILTGGTNQGVDAITCDALKDAQMTSWMGTAKAPSFKIIGVANWNRISQHTLISKWILSTDENTNTAHFEYHMRRVTFDHETGERFPAFNPICSNFVGVESGIHASKGTEVFVRSALEELIQSDPTDSSHFNGVGLNIPTVLILIGGDFDTFERAANAVEREIPIILCEGSGMATDIIAVAIRLSQKNSNFRLNADQESSLVKLMEHHLSAKQTKGKIFPAVMFEGSRHLPFLRKCVRYRKLVFFYRVDLSVSHLDVAIMRALLKSGPARRRDPVQLAVHWNRCDEVVEDHLSSGSAGAQFPPKGGGKKESKIETFAEKIAGFDINEKENIKALVTQALVEDKVEFIKLFLEHGLDIAKYLTTDQLAKIYSHACENYPPLVKLLKRARNGKSKPYFKIKHVYNLIQICTSARPTHQLKTLPDSKGEGSSNSGLRTFQDPFRELCIWAILTDKMEMSKFFWSRSKTPLMLALICSRLWEAHKTVVPPRDEQTRAEMVQNSEYYLKLASEMVDLAWHVNREMAADLVTYKYRGFERTNLMDLAAFIEAKEFIAHPLLQVAIDNLWKGGLTASLKQVLIAFLLPFRIPIFFRDQEEPITEKPPPAPEKKAKDSETEVNSPLLAAVASSCGAAAVTAITREAIFETDIDQVKADKERMGTQQRSKNDKRSKKINDFLEEDEETQRHLKAKRDLIKKAEVAKKEALRMEKKRLLETSGQGDVFVRAAAALRRIQQLKELTLKETHSSNASLLDEDDSDNDSGVEGDHLKAEGAHDEMIKDEKSPGMQSDDQFDMTDDAELHDSDDQLDIDILAHDRETDREQEQDHELCNYQVKNLEDEDDASKQEDLGSQGFDRDARNTPTGSSLINRWKTAGKNRSTGKKATVGSLLRPESASSKDHLESKNTSQWSLTFPKNLHNKLISATANSVAGTDRFDNLANSRLSLHKRGAMGTVEDLPVISSSILKPTSRQSRTRESETSSTSGESKTKGMSTKTMLYTFYTSPIAKFCMHTIAYLVFLAFFTISTIDTGQGMKSVWGMVSFQFMVCYALEAYRQLVTQRASWGMKLRIWAMSEWNIIELVYLSMGLVSFPLTSWESTRNTAIMMNCGINMLMWVRLLRFYQCSSKLGPMWIMIRKMMAETLWFLAIFIVIIISCGIFIFAVNVPEPQSYSQHHSYAPNSAVKNNSNQTARAGTNGAPMSVTVNGSDTNDYDYDYYYDYDYVTPGHPAPPPFYTKKSWIFIRPYLMSLGNQFLTWTYSGRNQRVTVWSCFFFVVIGNALMLNLLVAIYGGIFNEIVQKADIEWKTEMYWLMKDFESKTFLPPPISIVETFGLWLYFITRGRKKPVPPKTPSEESMISSLEILEAYCVQTILDTQEKDKTPWDVTFGVIKNREINCGKLHETIQTVDDLRKEVNKRNMEKQEKRRDKMRREMLLH